MRLKNTQRNNIRFLRETVTYSCNTLRAVSEMWVLTSHGTQYHTHYYIYMYIIIYTHYTFYTHRQVLQRSVQWSDLRRSCVPNPIRRPLPTLGRGHPHPHHVKEDIFPELVGAEDYCRNPGQLRERPWCFTTNVSVEWDYCDIPRCDSDGESCSLSP